MHELADSRHHALRAYFDHTKDSVSLFNREGTIVYVNPAFEQMYGLSADSVIGQKVFDIWSSPVPDVAQLFDAARRGEVTADYETRRPRPDGTWVVVALTLSPVRDACGRTYAFLAVSRDMTERRQAEQRLRDVEARFRMIDDTISDAVAIIDPRGRVEYASKSHATRLGLDIAAFLENPLSPPFYPADARLLKQTFRRVLKDRTEHTVECRLRHPDGDWKFLEVAISPILGADDSVHKVVTVGRDITRWRLTEQRLMQAEKTMTVGRMGAALAHEVRNPLTTIKGFLQLQEATRELNVEHCRLMLSELERLENIIEAFLDSARVKPQARVEVDLAGVLVDSVTMMRVAAHMNNIEITHDITDTPLRAFGEADRLKQVFINLLRNAIEAMDHGVIRVTAKRTASGSTLIEITDEGSGMPREVQERLGDPFFSTKEKGTGLGLMVCMRILREHGADLHFISEAGQGTTAIVEFPKSSNLPS